MNLLSGADLALLYEIQKMLSDGDDSVNSIGQSITAASCCISNPSPAKG